MAPVVVHQLRSCSAIIIEVNKKQMMVKPWWIHNMYKRTQFYNLHSCRSSSHFVRYPSVLYLVYCRINGETAFKSVILRVRWWIISSRPHSIFDNLSTQIQSILIDLRGFLWILKLHPYYTLTGIRSLATQSGFIKESRGLAVEATIQMLKFWKAHYIPTFIS